MIVIEATVLSVYPAYHIINQSHHHRLSTFQDNFGRNLFDQNLWFDHESLGKFIIDYTYTRFVWTFDYIGIHSKQWVTFCISTMMLTLRTRALVLVGKIVFCFLKILTFHSLFQELLNQY